jgi:hypothetical protein
VKDLITSVPSILKGIIITFTMSLYHANGNEHQQFRKPVMKIRARGMMKGSLSFQRNLNRRNSKFTLPGERI